MKIRPISFTILALLSAAVPAGDKEGKYAIKGVGNSTCQQYLTETRNRSYNAFVFAGFINGYLTAQNQHLKETFDLSSWETIDTLGAYLGGYCEKNPDHSFFMATAALVNALYGQRIQAYSPVLEIGTQKNTVHLYEEALKRARQKLAEGKFLKGPADGKYDAATQEAIKAFQKKEKLEVTGVPDQQTLHRLHRGKDDKPAGAGAPKP